MVQSETFPSPEDAALDGWRGTTGAEPYVLSVAVSGDWAEVVIEVGPGYPDYVYCVRTRDGWLEVSSGNMPTDRWEDPNRYGW